MVSLHEQNGGDYRSVLYIMMAIAAWLVLLPPLLYAARAETSAGLMRTRAS